MPFSSYNSYAFSRSCDWYPAACKKGPVMIALGLVELHSNPYVKYALCLLFSKALGHRCLIMHCHQ